ncbi:hypothetical protein DB459_23110 [Bradyrhizobium sp. WD16]|nr:hypothetical protein DB459_23110 [Bradyrhizobium sp. WD16]
MTAPPEALTRSELDDAVKRIFRRSQTDCVFRQRCLADAPAVILEMTGKVLPPGLVVEFRDDDGTAATTKSTEDAPQGPGRG